MAKADKDIIKMNGNDISSDVSDEDDEESQQSFGEAKNKILKAFDDRINQNKEELKQSSTIQQKKEEIFKIAKGLKLDIKNLDVAIGEIVKKHHNDYLNTFSTFMDSIRKELTQKLEEMEKQAEEKKKANDIRLIKCERDFFRLEAVRLNGICKSFKEKIDELSFRNKLLSDELNTLKIKWKESENINKQLLFELESNIQNHKEMEEELNMTKTMLNKKNNNIKVNINNSDLIESKNFNYENQEGSKMNNYIETEGKEGEGGEGGDSGKKFKEINLLNEKLRRYKTEAKIYKEKANKALSELNKIYLEKNKLENIFKDCVNTTKKIIYNRKLKENKSYKIKNKTGLGKYDYKINLTTKYEDFLPGDKQSTLENFLFNEEVYDLVKDAIFKHPPGSSKKNENAKKLMSDYNFYDPDWKMKEIIENASSDLPKNDTFLPLMSVGNKTKNNTFNKDNEFKIQNKDKINNQFYKTGKISIMNPFIIKKQQLGTSSKLTMNLQV
jgi:hypothetical protein